jgi:TonB family protein
MVRTLLLVLLALALLLLSPLAGSRSVRRIEFDSLPASEPDIRRASPVLLMASEKEAEPRRLSTDLHAPAILMKTEPEYTQEARDAGHQGSVLIDAVIGKDGSVKSTTVRRPLGMGLDEKAVKALSRWKFAPARLRSDNTPVEVRVTIEVNFRLK